VSQELLSREKLKEAWFSKGLKYWYVYLRALLLSKFADCTTRELQRGQIELEESQSV